MKKKILKNLIVAIAMVAMVGGNCEKVSAASYTSDAMATTTNTAQGWSFDDTFSHSIDLIPVYGGAELPVMITCGYEKILWIKNDYIKNVGGTASGYVACGFVGNSGGTKYTSWQLPGETSGKVTISHKSATVTYGVKIHVGL